MGAKSSAAVNLGILVSCPPASSPGSGSKAGLWIGVGGLPHEAVKQATGIVERLDRAGVGEVAGVAQEAAAIVGGRMSERAWGVSVQAGWAESRSRRETTGGRVEEPANQSVSCQEGEQSNDRADVPEDPPPPSYKFVISDN